MKQEKQLDYSDFELTFMDDFDGKKIDGNKWMTHYYWGHAHSDFEHQFYSSDAFNLKNSVLTINVRNRKVKGWYVKDGRRASKTFDVTSGLIHTGEFFKQRFGRFEIRCKVPKVKGYMPSFWLINPNAYPPEIDIMDYGHGDNDKLVVGYAYGEDAFPQHFHKIQKVIENIPTTEWAIYSLDWTPTTLTWYVNGYEVYHVKNIGIPQTPMYIAINLAIGQLDESTIEKSKMLIDWVKAYKFIK